MNNFQSFIRVLNSHIIRKKVQKNDFSEITDIELLSNVEEVSENCIYIATVDELFNFGKKVNGTVNSSVFVSNDKEFQHGLYDVFENVILTDLDKLTLYSNLVKLLRKCDELKLQLTKSYYEKPTVENIICFAAKYLNISFILFDEQWTVSASEILHIDSEAFLCKMVKANKIPNKLVEMGEETKEKHLHFSLKEEVYCYEMYSFSVEKKKYYILSIADPNRYMQDFFSYMIPFLGKILRNTQDKVQSHDQKVNNLISDILEGTLKTNSEIKRAFFQLGYFYEQDNFFCWVVIRNDNNLLNEKKRIEFIKDIKIMFQKTLITKYQDHILVLIFLDSYKMPIEQQKCLEEKLIQYGLRGCLSYTLANPVGLKFNYEMTKRALKLEREIHKTEKGLVKFEVLNALVIIDLCAEQLVKTNDIDFLKYLIHPANYVLVDYDLKNNGDLAECLHCYLMSGRNLIKTAELMHMHKNTVISRLKKISKLVSIDYDDPAIKLNIMFSGAVSLYYRSLIAKDGKIKMGNL